MSKPARIIFTPEDANKGLSSTKKTFTIDTDSNLQQVLFDLSLVIINLSNSNGHNKLNMAISADSKSNQKIITDTQSNCYEGDDPTTGSTFVNSTFKPDCIVYAPTRFLYVTIWLSTGHTADLDQIILTYRE